MTIYLDFAATTPVDPRVAELVMHHMVTEFGNEGSRTHEFGARAKAAVTKARAQVAAVAGCRPDEIVFTSGATESNNLAILGLRAEGERSGRKHVVSSSIEHKAVLEPLDHLRTCHGFEVTLLDPTPGGWIDPKDLRSALRPDTLLVSLMQVNNEIGVIQPVEDYAAVLADAPVYLHCDAAQGFAKLPPLPERVDLVSISGHKIFAPKGVGALVSRRRKGRRLPLAPLMFGGGQERGLRPGTLPVPSIAGLGLAAELAFRERGERSRQVRSLRSGLVEAMRGLGVEVHGDQARCLPGILNLDVPGVDSEALMVACKHRFAISNGSACTSTSRSPSHVLAALGLDEARIERSIRISLDAGVSLENLKPLVPLIRELQITA